MSRRRVKAVAAAAALTVAAAAAAVAPQASASAAPVSRPAPVPASDVLPPLGNPPAPLAAGSEAAGSSATGSRSAMYFTTSAAPTPSQCEAEYSIPCYNARILRQVYGTAGVQDEGKGATIALVMPYRNPVVRHDLDVYTSRAGLPAPDLHVYTVGHPVTASPGNFDQADAETEEELDLEMMLAMAPRVRLDLIETQTDFSLSPDALSYAGAVLDTLTSLRPRVDAASFSLGSSEENYAEEAGSTAAGSAEIRKQAAEFSTAIRNGITVMASTGDSGSASSNLAGTAVYSQPAVFFPASDPQITAVSATAVHADDSGTRTAPDTVWSNDGDNGATGGGVSTVFGRPSYQVPYASLAGDHRGVGDVAMDGASGTPVVMYSSEFDPFNPEQTGWLLVAGTSASSPLFTGVVALAAAKAGHPLGDINPALYSLARQGSAAGVEKVTSGCNTDYGIPGVCASSSAWSMPDGIGTVGDAAQFVPALVRAASRR